MALKRLAVRPQTALLLLTPCHCWLDLHDSFPSRSQASLYEVRRRVPVDYHDGITLPAFIRLDRNHARIDVESDFFPESISDCCFIRQTARQAIKKYCCWLSAEMFI